VRRRDKPHRRGTAIEYLFDLVDHLLERQLLLVNRTAISADLVVLAEAAPHVTAGEKDVTDSVFAA